MGHGSARIDRALSVREETIQRLVRGDARTISPQLRDAITGLYDAWWDKRAPGRTRAERAGATAARGRAIAGNWCAGAALDDDLLDVPGYRPRTGYRHRHRPRHPPACPPLPQERRMTDDRMNPDLITGIFSVLDRHGYARSDDEHTARAIVLISDLAHIYQGSRPTRSAPTSARYRPGRSRLRPSRPARTQS